MGLKTTFPVKYTGFLRWLLDLVHHLVLRNWVFPFSSERTQRHLPRWFQQKSRLVQWMKMTFFYLTRLNMWLPIILPENRTDPFPETLWSFYKMADNRQSQEQINPNIQSHCLSDHRQWTPMMTVFSCYDFYMRKNIDSSIRTSPYFIVLHAENMANVEEPNGSVCL